MLINVNQISKYMIKLKGSNNIKEVTVCHFFNKKTINLCCVNVDYDTSR